MECPHCFNEFDPNKYEHRENRIHIDDGNTEILVFHFECPDCQRASIYYCIIDGEEDSGTEFPIYPRPDSRKPCPPKTPEHIRQDYYEACMLIRNSPTASAIICRRILENVIVDVTGVEVKNLSRALDDLIANDPLPSNLLTQIEAIKHIGNLAAHGVNITDFGEPVSVSYKDADWSLKILAELLDYYYAQPAKIEKRQEELNKKLSQAGKKLMK